MDTIKEIVLAVINWLIAVDEQTLLNGLLIIASSTVVSYLLQYIKRRFGIDLWQKGKIMILALLGILSSIGSLADYYIQSPDASLSAHFSHYLAYIFMVATFVHRLHVSKTYAKIERVLQAFAQSLAATKPVDTTSPPQPQKPPTSFEG